VNRSGEKKKQERTRTSEVARHVVLQKHKGRKSDTQKKSLYREWKVGRRLKGVGGKTETQWGRGKECRKSGWPPKRKDQVITFFLSRGRGRKNDIEVALQGEGKGVLRKPGAEGSEDQGKICQKLQYEDTCLEEHGVTKKDQIDL